jgi:hypothetical protein
VPQNTHFTTTGRLVDVAFAIVFTPFAHRTGCRHRSR